MQELASSNHHVTYASQAQHAPTQRVTASTPYTVAALMCTYRGARYIERQLETIAAQSYPHWRLFVSDDGSDDETLEILQRFRANGNQQRVRIFHGPKRGFARNFFSLIARPEVRADFYAFTDQDDEWHPSKLARALEHLRRLPSDAPVLYGSRSELVDEAGRRIGFSRRCTRPSGFANALVQNIVSGNTMVLNHNALELIRAAGTDIDVSAHDWWAYLLITGSGGLMVYDPYPTVRYRQHLANLYGSNVSYGAMWRRVRKLLAGDYRDWNARNLAALRERSWLLHEDNKRLIDLFDASRSGGVTRRLFGLMRAGLYRQTLLGQLGLLFAAAARRL
jgi:glycosyltransferase involved in cell wall biosynthesis